MSPIPCIAIAATLILAVQPTARGQESKDVQLFILAGQSNMVGHGKVEMGRDPDYRKDDPASQREIEGGIGSLRSLAENEDGYGDLLDSEGNWVVRDDVWIYSTTDGGEHGQLSVGYGKGGWFGPELGFGTVIGQATDHPVLIVKTAWGGKSLAIDFRPPSAGECAYEDGGEQEGFYYREMVETVHEVTNNLGRYFPELEGRQVRVAGFGWHQGWNDAGSEQRTEEYEDNMVKLIADVRREFQSEDLPFVIANTGMRGEGARILEVQAAVGDPERHPELEGTVSVVDTLPFKRSTEQSPSHFGYHWNHNAESHYLVGEAMGEAMLELLR